MELNKSNQERLEIILSVINKKLTQKEAALKLGLSERQIRRIIKKYNDEGENAIIHNNTW